MVTLTKHVIPGPDIHCTELLARRGFLQHLPAEYCISEDQKKFYHLSAGPWRCAIWQYGAGYCITFIKSLDEGLRLQFLGQKPLISPWLYYV